MYLKELLIKETSPVDSDIRTVTFKNNLNLIVDQSDFDGKNFTCLYRSLIIDGEIEFICEEKEKYEKLTSDEKRKILEEGLYSSW